MARSVATGPSAATPSKWPALSPSTAFFEGDITEEMVVAELETEAVDIISSKHYASKLEEGVLSCECCRTAHPCPLSPVC